jgi:hypothetical protein
MSKGSDKSVRVTWRLPAELVERMKDRDEPLQTLLEAWARSRKPLPTPEPPEPTRRCTLALDSRVFDALQVEADRLSAETRRRWTPERVARRIYEMERSRAGARYDDKPRCVEAWDLTEDEIETSDRVFDQMRAKRLAARERARRTKGMSDR